MRFFKGVRGKILWYVNYISIFKNSQLKYLLKGGIFESNQTENHLVKSTLRQLNLQYTFRFDLTK